MTRFMMTLEEAVELVLYAFKNGENGDIFVQKAPAATIADLASAIKELYNADVPIKKIGTRHGEKLFETLVNREEMAKVDETEKYFKIPADTRDLNYNKYFNEGESSVDAVKEYTSHNTRRLNLKEVKDLLMTLRIVRQDILNEKLIPVYEP